MITTRLFKHSVPKYGNRPEENEDALELVKSPKKGLEIREMRCAIADGATQTSFSSLWANQLVGKVIDSGYVPAEKRLHEILEVASNAWWQYISKIDLPWHAQEKVRKGAFSTLLWISFTSNRKHDSDGGKWKAIAIGDSNLLVVRKNTIREAFPITRSTDFGSSPFLIGSHLEKNNGIKYAVSHGEWLPGDDFILATDAVSHYLLRQFEEGSNPLLDLQEKLLNNLQGKCNFEEWINDLRAQKEIRNDDSSLIWVRFFSLEQLI